MHNWLRTILALVMVFFGAAAHAADPKPYARDFLASDVVRLTEQMRKEATGYSFVRGKSAEELRKEAAAAADSGDYKQAGNLAAGAVTANPKDAPNWLALARIGVKADDAQSPERYD